MYSNAHSDVDTINGWGNMEQIFVCVSSHHTIVSLTVCVGGCDLGAEPATEEDSVKYRKDTLVWH
jgi:hypothetical protein